MGLIQAAHHLPPGRTSRYAGAAFRPRTPPTGTVCVMWFITDVFALDYHQICDTPVAIFFLVIQVWNRFRQPASLRGVAPCTMNYTYLFPHPAMTPPSTYRHLQQFRLRLRWLHHFTHLDGRQHDAFHLRVTGHGLLGRAWLTRQTDGWFILLPLPFPLDGGPTAGGTAPACCTAPGGTRFHISRLLPCGWRPCWAVAHLDWPFLLADQLVRRPT